MSIQVERLIDLQNQESDKLLELIRADSPKLSDNGKTVPYGYWSHEAQDFAVRFARINLLFDLIMEARTSNIPPETTRQPQE